MKNRHRPHVSPLLSPRPALPALPVTCEVGYQPSGAFTTQCSKRPLPVVLIESILRFPDGRPTLGLGKGLDLQPASP